MIITHAFSPQVYVNMTKPKLPHYQTKFEELISTLNNRMDKRGEGAVKPAVFFSYSWVNSRHAVELGTK